MLVLQISVWITKYFSLNVNYSSRLMSEHLVLGWWQCSRKSWSLEAENVVNRVGHWSRRSLTSTLSLHLLLTEV